MTLSPTCYYGSALCFKAATPPVMAAATTPELAGTFWRAEVCREGRKGTEMLGWKKEENPDESWETPDVVHVHKL